MKGEGLSSNHKLEKGQHWQDRFQNLERNPHNNLRITRILKCLGEFGFEPLKLSLVTFFVQEIFGKGALKGMRESCLNYWIETVKDDNDRG